MIVEKSIEGIVKAIESFELGTGENYLELHEVTKAEREFMKFCLDNEYGLTLETYAQFILSKDTWFELFVKEYKEATNQCKL